MLNLSLLGDSKLEVGNLAPGERVTSLKLIGDLELDFRRCESRVEVSAFTLIGDVRIRLRAQTSRSACQDSASSETGRSRTWLRSRSSHHRT